MDTAAKRRAALGVGLLLFLPAPDGTVSAVDRANLSGVYPAGETPPAPPAPPIPIATTLAEYITLLEADDLHIDAAAILLDADESFLADVSEDLSGAVVSRNMFRPIHGECRVAISRRLQWQRHRVKLSQTITSYTANLTATWDRGVWVLSTPERRIGETPESFDVVGWDKTVLLDTPCGRTFSMPSGSTPLTVVEGILSTEIANAGTVTLDQTAVATATDVDRVWAADVTWLTIVNECLAAVGYEGVWCDEAGTWRARPYRQPSERTPAWSFSAESASSIVGEDRVESSDTTDTPNVWVGFRRNVDAPADGAGRVEVVDLADGDTSLAARGGRVVRWVGEFDAIDDTVLLTMVQAKAASDRMVARKLALTTGVVPLLWHLDVVQLTDAAITGSDRWAVEEWSSDLFGEVEMGHRWRQVVTV